MKKILLASALLAAISTQAQADEVEIAFALQAGATPVSCSSPPTPLGKSATPARLRDARFYVQNPRLIRADGSESPLELVQNDWQSGAVALIDFEDASGGCDGNKDTNTHVIGKVAPGHYVGLAFEVGVPPELNHSNPETAAAPLDVQSMAWNWQAGRKFMKVEVLPEGGIKRATDTTRIWTLHLGSTGCVGNPAKGDAVACSHPNRVPVRFKQFDPKRDTVVLDLQSLFANAELSKDRGGASGCMSALQDPECADLFPRLGLRLTDSAPGADNAGQPLGLDVPPMFRKAPR